MLNSNMEWLKQNWGKFTLVFALLATAFAFGLALFIFITYSTARRAKQSPMVQKPSSTLSAHTTQETVLPSSTPPATNPTNPPIVPSNPSPTAPNPHAPASSGNKPTDKVSQPLDKTVSVGTLLKTVTDTVGL